MTTTDPRTTPVTERYPGETLDLLRKVSADLDYLRGQLAVWEPLLEGYQKGGLLGGRRAARRGMPL